MNNLSTSILHQLVDAAKDQVGDTLVQATTQDHWVCHLACPVVALILLAWQCLTQPRKSSNNKTQVETPVVVTEATHRVNVVIIVIATQEKAMKN